MHSKSGAGTPKPGTVCQAIWPKRKEVGVTSQEDGAPNYLTVVGVSMYRNYARHQVGS